MPTGEKRNRIERITMVCRRVHCPIFCYLILAGLASMLASVNLNAQSITWQKTNGPYVSIKSLPDNVPINFLAVGPGDILFAASPPNYYVPIWGKLYRSTDRGVNWIPADSGWIPDSTKSLVFAQSGVAFMSTQSTDGCNVFVSTNGGRSWTIEGFLGGAHAFAVDSSGIIYWGGGGGEGVYKSTVDSPPWTIDDWQRGGMGNIVVDCLAALSNFKVIAGTWQGIMFSPDSAHTWLSTNVEDDGVNWFALLPNEHLFASSLDSGVFRSIDSGKTWTSTITGLPSLKIDGFSKGPDDYLYATIFGKGILMSTDEGGSWQSINGNLPSLFTYAVVVTSDSVIFLGTSEGLYCSSDHGTTWNRSAQGFSTEYSAVNAIAIEDSLLFAGGNGGIYLSSDDGVSWKQVGLPDTTVLSLFIEKGETSWPEPKAVVLTLQITEAKVGTGEASVIHRFLHLQSIRSVRYTPRAKGRSIGTADRERIGKQSGRL